MGHTPTGILTREGERSGVDARRVCAGGEVRDRIAQDPQAVEGKLQTLDRLAARLVARSAA